MARLKTEEGGVGKHFGVHKSTVKSTKKNEIIRKAVWSGTKSSAKLSSYIRDVLENISDVDIR